MLSGARKYAPPQAAQRRYTVEENGALRTGGFAMTSTNRRRFVRVDFKRSVRLTQGSNSWHCSLIDISLKGALIKLPQEATPSSDEVFTLELRLDEQTHIRLIGQQSHLSDQLLGLEICEIDVESMGHLRQLISLNTGDAAAAERELRQLVTH